MTLSRGAAFRQLPGRVAAQGLPPAGRFAIGLVLVFCLVGLFVSGSPLTVLTGGAAFIAIVLMLWRSDDLPILLLPALYQWLEVAVKPILSVIYAQPVERVLDIGFNLQTGTDKAAVFGFAGVACLSGGMWIGARKVGIHADHAVRVEARNWKLGLVLRLSLSLIILGHVIDAFAGMAGGAIQLVLPLSGIKFVGLFALAYWCFINATGYRYLVAVMAVEIVIGLTGFFADFRGPVLVLAIAALAARPSLRLSSIASMTIVATIILCVSTFWSEIKMDYRAFANGGTGAQTTVQPLGDRLTYIYDATLRFNGDQFADGFNRLLARFSYIDFLGATLSYVPRMLPHEGGKLIGATFENMLMPRLLFPNKPPLPNDTEITRRYTGIDINGADETSISIGYLGDLYIDFGYIGALIATALFGMAAGFGYRLLRDYDRAPRLISYGACVMLALSLADFGTELVKFVNGAVLTVAAALAVQRLIAPRILAFYLPHYRRQSVPANRR